MHSFSLHIGAGIALVSCFDLPGVYLLPCLFYNILLAT